MRVLRHRPTRHFLALLIVCRCGRKFLHRLDRPTVVCLHCGEITTLALIAERLRAGAAQEQGRIRRAARAARVA
jgi:hypothetical protein